MNFDLYERGLGILEQLEKGNSQSVAENRLNGADVFERPTMEMS